MLAVGCVSAVMHIIIDVFNELGPLCLIHDGAVDTLRNAGSGGL